MDIDQIPAGIELDVLVAETLGYIQVTTAVTEAKNTVFIVIKGIPSISDDRVYISQDSNDFTHFAPSTDIAAAFQVVDKLLDGTRIFVLESYMPKDDGWQATFKGKLNWKAALYEQLVYAYAETRPLAICRAALKVIKEET